MTIIHYQTEPNEYMAFGASGANNESKMEGADVNLVYYDATLQTAKVADYILADKSQCAPQSNTGACPDTYLGGKEDSSLVSYSYEDGILKVLYKRAIDTQDIADQKLDVSIPGIFVAAIGPLNGKQEAAYHNIAVTRRNDPILRWTLNRPEMRRNCEPFEHLATEGSRQATRQGWEQAVLRDVNKFRVIIGPAGGTRGYTAITGTQSWGIAYWVNKEVSRKKFFKMIDIERTFSFS